jgi:hypothetical protein
LHLGVLRTTLTETAAMIAAAWGADSAWIDDWDPRNAPRGQCGSTALVLQDLWGGALLRGVVEEPAADEITPRRIVHYWNVIGARDVDFTWEQFAKPARVVLRAPAQRSELLCAPWFVERYCALRARVLQDAVGSSSNACATSSTVISSRPAAGAPA